MKADTFAKLIVLETLIDAEVGYFLTHRTPSMELFREGMVSRIGDLVDAIDALDAVAAARIYDAIVDFLADLPDHDDGVVEATIQFRRAVDRIVERGMEAGEVRQASTWAAVLGELLGELAGEYRRAVEPGSEIRPRECLRAETLLARSREAADRMLWEAGQASHPELRADIDRLTFAVRYRRLPPAAVEALVADVRRRADRYRPSTLTRIGAFVVQELLRRNPVGRRQRQPKGSQKPRPA